MSDLLHAYSSNGLMTTDLVSLAGSTIISFVALLAFIVTFWFRKERIVETHTTLVLRQGMVPDDIRVRRRKQTGILMVALQALG